MNKMLFPFIAGALLLASCNNDKTTPGETAGTGNTVRGTLKLAQISNGDSSDVTGVPAVKLSDWNKGVQTITAYAGPTFSTTASHQAIGTAQTDAAGNFSLQLSVPDLSSATTPVLEIYNEPGQPNTCTTTQQPVISDTSARLLAISFITGTGTNATAVYPGTSSTNAAGTQGSIGSGQLIYANKPVTLSAKATCTIGSFKLDVAYNLHLLTGFNRTMTTMTIDNSTKTGTFTSTSAAFPTTWYSPN